MIIGLGHQKRQGKDTFANMLQDSLNARGKYTRVLAFADPLYEICAKMYGHAGFLAKCRYDSDAGHLKETPLNPPLYGQISPRDILLRIGEKLREFDHLIWVNYALSYDSKDVVTIITDVRHPNEVEAIQKAGGKLVKIVRPSMPVNPKPDDIDGFLVGWDGWDYTINNDGDLTQLKVDAIAFANEVTRG